MTVVLVVAGITFISLLVAAVLVGEAVRRGLQSAHASTEELVRVVRRKRSEVGAVPVDLSDEHLASVMEQWNITPKGY